MIYLLAFLNYLSSTISRVKSTLKVLFILVISCVIFSDSAALAVNQSSSIGDLSRQPITEIIVSLGNSNNEREQT
jgi:hypothetical protein